jgi:hypothetical protein
MKPTTTLTWVRRYAAAVGAMDFVTGLALVAAPALTLRSMGAVPPGAEALGYVRFAGVFVGAVGATYLAALGRGGVWRLTAALEMTFVVRVGAGLFSGVAVAVGMFDPAWLIVAATDLGCAALQGWILAKGMGDHD